jgi:hypothetical protein
MKKPLKILLIIILIYSNNYTYNKTNIIFPIVALSGAFCFGIILGGILDKYKKREKEKAELLNILNTIKNKPLIVDFHKTFFIQKTTNNVLGCYYFIRTKKNPLCSVIMRAPHIETTDCKSPNNQHHDDAKAIQKIKDKINNGKLIKIYEPESFFSYLINNKDLNQAI